MNLTPDDLVRIDADLRLIEDALDAMETPPAEAVAALVRLQSLFNEALLADTGDAG